MGVCGALLFSCVSVLKKNRYKFIGRVAGNRTECPVWTCGDFQLAAWGRNPPRLPHPRRPPSLHPSSLSLYADHNGYGTLIIDGFQLPYGHRGNIRKECNIRLRDWGTLGQGDLTACKKVGISKDSACCSCNFKIQKYALHVLSTDRL